MSKNFSIEEIEYLKTQYLNLSDDELSEFLNRPIGSIKKKRERLGLLRFYQESISPISDEIWINLPEHIEYSISNKGRVKNEKGLIKPFINRFGYVRLSIRRRDREFANYDVHRLVAILFCNPPLNHIEMDVHHIDGNTLNNSSYNLKWLTKQEHKLVHSKK